MKRKKLILTAVALALCLSLFTFGVFAVISPKISITGKVSYQIKDASVIVQGKVLNAKDYETKEIVHSEDYSTIEINNQSQYYKNSADLLEGNNTLEQWDISTLTFTAGDTDFNPITIKINFTNNSNYSLSGTITFNSSTVGITRNVNAINNEFSINANSSYELVITYTLNNKYSNLEINDIGMSILIDKA